MNVIGWPSRLPETGQIEVPMEEIPEDEWTEDRTHWTGR
jgi:hypothetical protein